MSPSLDFVYDVVGIGFGPANIAIAAALNERRQSHVSLLILHPNLFTHHP